MNKALAIIVLVVIATLLAYSNYSSQDAPRVSFDVKEFSI